MLRGVDKCATMCYDVIVRLNTNKNKREAKVNTFQVIGKSPARSTDRKNVVYVTGIGAGSYGIWNRTKSTKTAEQMAREVEEGTAGVLVINPPRPFAPTDAVSLTLAEGAVMAGYNAPDNY